MSGSQKKLTFSIPLYLLLANLFIIFSPQTLACENIVVGVESHAGSDGFWSGGLWYPDGSTPWYPGVEQDCDMMDPFDPVDPLNEPDCPDGTAAAGDLSSCPITPETEIGQPDDVCGSPKLASTGIGNPINSATGNKYQVEVDYNASVTGGLNFIRSYNSQASDTGKPFWQSIYPNTLGQQWRHHYQRSLVVIEESSTTGRVAMIRPDGQVIYFTGNDSATDWVATTGETQLTAQYDATGGVRTGWDYKDSSNLVEHYDINGNVTSIEVSPQLTQTLQYDAQNRLQSVTDPFGRVLQFNYSTDPADQKIASITLPDLQQIHYSYDSQDRLSTVQYPDTTPLITTDPLPIKTYHYENSLFPYALTGITDEKNQRFATWGYDVQGRANSSEHAGGVEHNTLVYDDINNTTTITNTFGQVKTYHFSTINGMQKLVNVDGAPSATCSGRISSMTFDAQGNPDIITDYRGNQTDIDYNSRGLITQRTEAAVSLDAERTVVTQWHPTFNLPLVQSYSGKISNFYTSGVYKRVDFSYDTVGRLLSKTELDPRSNQSRSVQYSYNSQGLLASIDGPRTDVSDITLLEYDTQGNLLRIRNALNHVTEFLARDAHGRATQIQDPNGLITELDYDTRGRLAERRIGGVATQFAYDAVGQVTKMSYPDGSELNYQYDSAHRLTGISDSQGNQIQYTLDTESNRTQEQKTDANGLLSYRLEQEFDSLSRLLLSIDGENQVSRFRYDKNDNVTAITDPRNSGDRQQARTLNPDQTDNSIIRLYDELNRVIESKHLRIAEQAGVAYPSDDVITRYQYNSLDQLTQVEDAEMVWTTYEYNGFGELTQEQSPSTGITLYEYDTSGNRVKKTDAKGIVTQYHYDVLNRITQVQYPDSTLNANFTYDIGANGLGKLTQTIDPSGQKDYHYNTLGELSDKQIQRTGLSVSLHYQYNTTGQLKQITYPSGQKVDYHFNSHGKIDSVILTKTDGSTQVLANNITYQPFGASTQLTLGNGVVITQSYNLKGELTDKQQSTILSQQFDYDAAGNILHIIQPLQSNDDQQFTYNGLNQLTQATGTYGTLNYQLNSTNDRTYRTDNNGGGITSEYGFGSHRLESTVDDDWMNYLFYQYDANGNIIDNGQYQFSYVDHNRLSHVTQAGQTVADYSYNANGERIKKAIPGQPDQHYYYHQQQLIAESNGSGQAQQEYVYLNGVPLALLDYGTGTLPQVYYYHTDHLGTPLKLTDATQQVVWQGVYKPFGEVDVAVSTVTNNLRFAGQYFDAETSLHYNYYRYYDPSTGRYITSDPIGLAGGLNTYAYVDGNPVNFIDPEGLAPRVTPNLSQATRNPVFRNSPWHPRNVANNSKAWKNYFEGVQKNIPKNRIRKPANDVPTWAKGNRPFNYERPTDFAQRLCENKFGKGEFGKGPSTPFNQIKKWAERHFEPTQNLPSLIQTFKGNIPPSYWSSSACYSDGMCI